MYPFSQRVQTNLIKKLTFMCILITEENIHFHHAQVINIFVHCLAIYHNTISYSYSKVVILIQQYLPLDHTTYLLENVISLDIYLIRLFSDSKAGIAHGV